MPRAEVDRFQSGDVVIRGAEKGYVFTAKNGRTGETFLSVRITVGPKKGQFDKPWKGWTPQLDRHSAGMRSICVDCSREFRGAEPGESKEIWCATCQREHDGEDHRRAADPSYTSSSYERKQTREGMRG